MRFAPIRDFLMELVEQVVRLTLHKRNLDGRRIAIDLGRNLQKIVDGLGLAE